jgi:hypothetical protein
MATIRIADAGGPPRPDGSGIGGGVYPIRATSIERSRTRSRSRDARSRHSDLKDAEEDAELRQDGDFKKRQVRLIRTIIMACFSDFKQGLQREDAAIPCLSEHRRDLWRYRNQSSLCLQFHFHF